MFILSSISSGLKFGWLNHTSNFENSETKVFKIIQFLGGISNNDEPGGGEGEQDSTGHSNFESKIKVSIYIWCAFNDY